MVEFPSASGRSSGYLATAEAGAGPGLVVVHDRWGLVKHVTEVCDRFSAEGFTALAPDLYSGVTVSPRRPDDAHNAMMAVDPEAAGGHLAGAVEYLLPHQEVRGDGVGLVGFGMGGGLALWFGSLRPAEVHAVVTFYGIAPWAAARPDHAALRAVQGHFGENDEFFSADDVRRLREKFESHGLAAQLHVYPRLGHGFVDDTRPEGFDDDAARIAWIRTLEFLRKKLG